jgi:hypothetical protein
MSNEQTVKEMAADAIARTWPWVITLKHPVDFGDERITSLTVRRGRLGDLKGIKLGGDAMPADHLMLVASRMTGQPLKVIESLDPEDAEEVMSLVLDFFAKCLGGGRTR